MSNEELVAEIQAGAVERMGELWEQIEKLVKRKANRVMTALDGRGGVEFDDLYQSGYPALAAAVDSYSPENGAFSTWYMYHLKTAFAETTGCRTQRGKREPLNNCISLDTPLSDDADSDDLMDVIADPAGQKELQSLEEALYQVQLHDALEAALNGIPPQYSQVLRSKHYQGLTLVEVGENLGVSYERVRQIENRAIRELRKPRYAKQLYPFYDFDFYSGTGLGSFLHSGMSVQERYLVIQDERKERQDNRLRKACKEKNKNEYRSMIEDINRETEARVAAMTSEEKQELLAKYGYA